MSSSLCPPRLIAFMVFAMVTLAGASGAAQTTYYVSPAGSDSNSGESQSDAFATIQAAASIVAAGDTVRVLAGTYAGFNVDSRSGEPNARIAFVADPGVFIVGESSVPCQRHEPICLWESDYVTVEGFDVTCGHFGYGQGDCISVRAYGSQGHAILGAVVRRNTLHDGDSRGIYLAFAVDARLEDNEIANTGLGIYFANGAPASFGDEQSSFLHNHIHDVDGLAIHVNGDLSAGGDGIIRGLIVDGNVVIDNASQGIHFDGVDDSVVMNNVVAHNSRGIVVSRVDGAQAPAGNVVVNNTVIQDDGTQACLRLGGGATGTLVFNNVFLHHGGVVADLDGIGEPLGAGSDYNATNDLSGLAGATTGDSHSLEVEESAAGFTDVAGGDFSLVAGSPLVDVGAPSLGGQAAPDHDGTGKVRPLAEGFDIGAFEYGDAPDGGAGGTGSSSGSSSGTGGSSSSSGTGGATSSSGGSAIAEDDSGCGCRLPPAGGGLSPWTVAGLLGLGAVLAARRRIAGRSGALRVSCHRRRSQASHGDGGQPAQTPLPWISRS